MFSFDFWISAGLGIPSLGLNMAQWIQHKIERGGLWHIKTAVNQLLARCNDAKKQGLIGLRNYLKTPSSR